MTVNKRICPECEFAKIPVSVLECPECGFSFEAEAEAPVIDETAEEISAVSLKIGVISLLKFDENGERTLSEVARIQPGETLTFGRASKKKTPDVNLANFISDAGGISGLHFQISDGVLIDLGSSNGTYIIHHLTPADLAPEVRESLLEAKFSIGWREDGPIKMQILCGIPLLPDEPYQLEDGTEFRVDASALAYTEEEVSE